MFTGLVETVGTIRAVRPEGAGRRLEIDAGPLTADATIGDSICISGVCLTVTAINGPALAFQAGPETLKRSTLGGRRAGSAVNLERALSVGARLGGHFVQGHVDGVARIDSRSSGREWDAFVFAGDSDLTGWMVPKGSIAIDGVSLTLVDVDAGRFSVALIPHTLAHTTLGSAKVGDTVNIETDVLGKYVRRFLEQGKDADGVSMDDLHREGFV